MASWARRLARRARAVGAAAASTRLHHRKGAEARDGLRRIEAVRGPTGPALLRQADEYAADALGWSGYAPWLRLYAAASGRFHEGWLPDNYYLTVVAPKVNGDYRWLTRIRGCNRILFSGEGFPDIGYVANGLLLDGAGCVVPWDDAQRRLASAAAAGVFKSDSSSLGQGVRFLDLEQLDATTLRSAGNGVIQRRLSQHPTFDAFVTGSVTTVRLLTAVDDRGEASARAAYVRFGRSRDSHVLAHDQVRVAADLQTGAFAHEGYLSDWTPVDRHPDSRMAFDGGSVPNMSACVDLVRRLHARVPQMRCVSWDLVVEPDGRPQVLEWESGVVSFAEATQGPCLADLGWDRLHRAAG